MRRKWFFGLILSIVLLLTGCFSNPVQDDLLSYINDETKSFTDLEIKAVTAYESVTGANYTDDLTMYTVLTEDVIPTYNEFIKELETVNIETDELRNIHEGYIEGANLQYNAFVKLVSALENQDISQVEEANKMLEEARKLIRDYQVNIEKLATENNVEIQNQ